MHTASPFFESPSPQADLVDPALKGTMNVRPCAGWTRFFRSHPNSNMLIRPAREQVLKAAAKSGTVKRVVMTSDAAAIVPQFPASPSEEYSEADWQEDSTLAAGPYRLAKREAERAAWDFVEKRETRWP